MGEPRIDDTTLTVGGLRIAARRVMPARADRDGAAHVLLHEGLGSIAQWKGFPRALAEALGAQIVLWDRPGHGGSDPPARPRDARYLHRAAWEEMPAVMAALGLRAPPVLIGHSDGGTIALLYAARFPARAVATVAAHVFVEDATLAGIEATARAWARSDLPRRLARYHGDKTDATFRAWADTWRAPWFRDWDIVADIAPVSAPCLIMQGQADEYGTPAQIDAIARAVSGPAETLLLPGLGHAPHLEAPGAVIAALAGFLGRLRRAASMPISRPSRQEASNPKTEDPAP